MFHQTYTQSESYQHESIHINSSNNAYEVNNYNNYYGQTLSDNSSENSNTINKIYNKYSITKTKQLENNQTQSNHTQHTIQTYDFTLQNYLYRKKYMTNNNLKKASRKIREKEEPVWKNIYIYIYIIYYFAFVTYDM